MISIHDIIAYILWGNFIASAVLTVPAVAKRYRWTAAYCCCHELYSKFLWNDDYWHMDAASDICTVDNGNRIYG